MSRDYRYPSQAALVLLQALQTPDPVQPPPGTYAARSPAVPAYPSAVPSPMSPPAVPAYPSAVPSAMSPLSPTPPPSGPKSALRRSLRFTPVDYKIEEIKGRFNPPSHSFAIYLKKTTPASETIVRTPTLVKYLMTDKTSAENVLGYATLEDKDDYTDCMVYKFAANTYEQAHALLMHIYNEHIVSGVKCIILPKNSRIDYTKLLNGQWSDETEGMKNCAKAALSEEHKIEDWADQPPASNKKKVTIEPKVTISDTDKKNQQYTKMMYFAGASPDLCAADEVESLTRQELNLPENVKFFTALYDINLCQGSTYLAEAAEELKEYVRKAKSAERSSSKSQLKFWFLHKKDDATSNSVCAVAVTRLVEATPSYVYLVHICYRRGTEEVNAKKIFTELQTYAVREGASFMLTYLQNDESSVKNNLLKNGFKEGVSNSMYYRLDGGDEDPVLAGQARDENKKKTRK